MQPVVQPVDLQARAAIINPAVPIAAVVQGAAEPAVVMPSDSSNG